MNFRLFDQIHAQKHFQNLGFNQILCVRSCKCWTSAKGCRRQAADASGSASEDGEYSEHSEGYESEYDSDESLEYESSDEDEEEPCRPAAPRSLRGGPSRGPVAVPRAAQSTYCNACHIGLVVEDEQCGILVCNSCGCVAE